MPALPVADVPRRPKSLSNLRHTEFVVPRDGGVAATEDAPPPRPKSRNDVYELKASRYGRRKGNGKATVDVSHIQDELDFADWYGELEEQLEDASNEEYRYGVAATRDEGDGN